MQIRPLHFQSKISQYWIAQYVQALIHIMELCISDPDAAIEDLLRPNVQDLNQIWKWNHDLPLTYDCCMHDIISQRANEHPEKTAIQSWDGSLSYRQVDRYSTFLASLLRQKGVKTGEFLPLCFEKSRWTVVAVLAVMKAGGTMVMMDPALPLARLQNMAEQVHAKTMIASRSQYALSTNILPDGDHIILEEDTFAPFQSSQTLPALPAVLPSTLMYIIFTSGSTGTPKGVQISHGSYSSSAFPRAKAVGYHQGSRVLDFASYAFDVSIDSMILTLANSGCLCIPSDDERLNDINTAMRQMKVNYAGITPSVARILDLEVIASLEGLGLGGEAASVSDVAFWGQYTRIIIGYGPCECTIGCTVNSNAAKDSDYITIGPGNGAAIWIVDPDDHEALLPVGAVGELLVEGPIVGQGYLNDPEKTAVAFIQDPSWLVAGHAQYTGRRGRLYKTGDLGKYAPDGSGEVIFVGRKDTQVKLRGQRVELGEIESQLKARLPSEAGVIAEVITPSGSGSQPTLIAFVSSQTGKAIDDRQLELAELPRELRETMSKAATDIANVLPRYMIPTTYIPVNYIPTLISGKIDRKRLREFGTTVDLRRLERRTKSAASRAFNDLEQKLRQAWASVLKLDQDDISLEDNFFALGGNSLAAMRLVSSCRDQGLDLSVSGMFANPILEDMASVVFACDHGATVTVPAFSMISQLASSARREASLACATTEAAVQDIYPSTPTQESLFTFSLKSAKPYIAQRVACIPSDIALHDWKQAWESVVEATPILRTRLAQLQDPGLQQVVLEENIVWNHSTDLAQYLEDDRARRMDLGQSLARWAIVHNDADGKRYMVWTIHHVLYDGWSEPIILEKVREVLQRGKTAPSERPEAHMRDFVKYVRDTDLATMQQFWQQELDGAVDAQFPSLPSRDFLPNPDTVVERQIPITTTAGFPFTLATVIRGAWALVASQYMASDDVVFGETLTGRDISLQGVEGIIGPLIATVPIRIRINRAISVKDYLKAVQRAILGRTPYQHMGMQHIRRVSQDAQHACEAGTGLVIQPQPEYDGTDLGFDQGDVVREALHFNPYPLMLACGMHARGFRVCASFDSSLIDIGHMKRILAQLETACSQLMKDLNASVGKISCIPETELSQIWQFNRDPPVSFDETSKKLRAAAEIQPGSMYPPFLVPWVCKPGSPSLLAPIGCAGELWVEGPIFASSETIEPPDWLLTGSSEVIGRGSRLQATGDIVKLQEDGQLLFIGRAENIAPVNGHSVDVHRFEAHFAHFLPQSSRAVAAIYRPENEQPALERLVVLIEQQCWDGPGDVLLSEDYKISCTASDTENAETYIYASIPSSLTESLRRLDKFIRNSLPSHMLPFAYVAIHRMPMTKGQVDHRLVNQLASRIPVAVMAQLQENLSRKWDQSLVPANLTLSENILRSAWAAVLGISMDQIDVDDNFFRLGGDSVSAMKLTSSLRRQGHGLSVAAIFQNMRLGDAARVLKVNQLSDQEAEPYRAFATLGSIDVDLFLSEFIRPKLSDPRWAIKDVLIVTDSQALDIRATIQKPRTSMQYTMLYFEQASVNQSTLIRACSDLVECHDILRTVFVEHNTTLFQVVLDKVYVPVTIQTADTCLDDFIASLCTDDVESEFELGSLFVKFYFVQGNNGQCCLVLGLSHAQYDGISLPRLLQDLETLYTGGQVGKFEPFSAYVAQTQNERRQNKALDYWGDLLDGSTLSILPGQSANLQDTAVFRSKQTEVSSPPEGITAASVLTAAFALVIARRTRTLDVSFGGVTSGRGIDLANVENVVGPCYQFTPIRIVFQPQWSAMDLLQSVQRQNAESAAHDFVGFQRIAQKCAVWSSGASFFDSIVHHQDFEDFDHMPFANGTCRVEILNPHGDAAYPLKAVSFFRDGKLNVGIVGNQADLALADSLLEQLVLAVEEVVRLATEQALLEV
ncbi:non-ribosomal peptide synthetase [Trichoderma citrinoviride]|uniref:Non-ribosomal peptide synthetase n=1 Tax=Trichoderma citrinoviride TaxID=58853 RepID=A0A2T4B1Q4_9HYPO|nr:non-ribosomal peptide synthetase [Trichoderma citrinoviride]PTB63259.1 non-ribosomal peptide synthetase [Trichoderma citrinoviride]